MSANELMLESSLKLDENHLFMKAFKLNSIY